MSVVLSQDRTAEFRSAVKARFQSQRQRPPNPEPARSSGQSARAQFMKNASHVAEEIASTTQMLQRLAQLAKRRAMFDDKPQDIADLTVVIKQKVNSLKDMIAGLDRQTKDLGGTKRDEQADTLSRNVVMTLQGKLQEVTGNFTKVLEERSQNMQTTRNRTGQLITPRQVTPTRNPLYQENPFAAVGSSELDNNNGRSDELLLPSQEQSMVLLEDQQSTYLSQRSSAVDVIESTIQELGQMFGQLSNIIAEQRDTVQRIDANTTDIVMNVGGAHKELLKYFARVSSNRMLFLKVFFIVIALFTLWTVVT